jgi:lambda family phage tail tape measure protein
MADLKAQLEISADASGVEAGVSKAKRSLADLGATASTAGKQASDGLSTMGRGGEQSAAKIDAATKNMIGSIQRTIATMEAGSRSSSKYFETLATQRGVDTSALKPYLDQLDAVAAKQKVVDQSLRSTDPALKQVGVSAAQTAFALRQLPAQMGDIAISLQGGQRPLTVFLQQGSQIKDMFGGIGPAAKAIGGYIAGLVNPFTIAAAAAGSLALAYHKGSQEADAYARSLILTGNAAGLTGDKLQSMADRIAAARTTQHEAAAALAEFASTGRFSGDSLEKFAAVAVRIQEETGQAVSDTVKQFVELGKDPVAASVKLNETTRFLTAEVYNQIKALAEQGRTAEAAVKAQDAYADVMNRRMDQLAGRLGTIEKLWKDIALGAKLGWDAMLDIGRPSTNFDKINTALSARESLEKQLQSAEKYGDSQRAAYLKKQLDGNLALINSLRAVGDADRAKAAKEKEDAEKATGKIRLDSYLDNTQYADSKTKYSLEVKKENAAFAEAVKGFSVESKEYEKALARHKANLASIAEQNKDKIGLGIDKGRLGLDIETIQAASQKLVGIYKNSESIMESVHAAGLMSDRDYYESKRAFIRLESSAQEDALQKEIARYQQAKLTGKAKLDNDKTIAELEVKLAILRGDTTAKLVVLSNQEEAAARRLQLSYLTARQAAQDYFDVLQRQQNRDLASLGQGAEKRRFDAGINQIEDRYAGQRRDLENQKAQLELEGKFTEDARTQYEQRLAIINEFQAKSIDSYKAYYDELMKKQGDWSLGASEGLNNYLDESRNVFRQTERLVSNAFQGMEDALVNFVTTGKLSFGDLAKSILADLARMEIKAAMSSIFGKGGLDLASLLKGGSGTFASDVNFSANAWESMIPSAKGNIFDGGSVVKFANGGAFTNSIATQPTMAPMALFGEAGPEAIMPLMRGPDGSLGVKANGETQPAQINHAPVININGSGLTPAQAREIAIQVAQASNAHLVDQLSRARRI